MQRRLISGLKKWKNSKKRKPMMIMGAARVGKTWLMREFGRVCYEKSIYISMAEKGPFFECVLQGFDKMRIMKSLQEESGFLVFPEKTLIILDDMQEFPKAAELLRYFAENLAEYHVVASGSLMGFKNQGMEFSGDTVEQLFLYPLDFVEFLQACGEERMAAMLCAREQECMTNFKDRYMDFLRFYYYVGGMPEAVETFCRKRDMRSVRSVQEYLLRVLEKEFFRYTSGELFERVQCLWEKIPQGLMKEKDIEKQDDLDERALEILVDAGLVYCVNKISRSELPLKNFTEHTDFRVFMLDVGLMAAMLGLNARVVVYGNKLFGEFQGILTKQYVMQQLRANKSSELFYWPSDTAGGEVDFVFQYNEEIIPVEIYVEGIKNKFMRTLKSYCNKYHPEYAFSTSEGDYDMRDWMMNIPLYGIGVWWKKCEGYN